MFVSDCLEVNAAGNLAIGGADTLELAATYATPLYVMDEKTIRTVCRRYRSSMEEFYGGHGVVTYASKAFCCKEICRIVNEEGLYLDAVSGGELYTALAAGVPPGHIFFHGNNKTAEELAYAVRENTGFIVVDNTSELELLNQIAAAADKKVDILFRLKPGVDASTHAYVQTGNLDSKFGLAISTGEAMQAVGMALDMPHIELKGIHCHIGSQIFDLAPFELTAAIMTGFLADIKDLYGKELEILNLGGGFGIRYIPEQEPVEYEKFMKQVSKTVKKTCAERGLGMPFIVIEPGRSIVGSSGITLYKVGSVKEIPGIRTYVSVDGGMTDNPRYALYGSEYEMLVANKASQPKQMTVTVAGRCCESGDLIGEDIPIQNVKAGDILAVLATGAYNYAMSSNYNRVPKPAVVMIGENGEPRIMVKRETYEDIARNDL